MEVAPVATADAQRALELPMSDLEDAMQAAAALSAGATVIVTRNIRDYSKSPVRAVTPDQLLKELAQRG